MQGTCNSCCARYNSSTVNILWDYIWKLHIISHLVTGCGKKYSSQRGFCDPKKTSCMQINLLNDFFILIEL